MEKILIGFDGSEGAENALNKAMLLVDDDGELILLAVVHTPSDKSFVDEEAYKTYLKNNGKENLSVIEEYFGTEVWESYATRYVEFLNQWFKFTRLCR